MMTEEFDEVNEAYADLLAACLNGDRVRTRNSDVLRMPCHKNAIFCFDRTPLVSLRKTAWKNALREMEWMLSGSVNVNKLHLSVQPWWKPWADTNGNVKYAYGKQMRDFDGNELNDGYKSSVDQVDELIAGLREHPYSRRNILTTWQAFDMRREDCPITTCHNTVTQAFVDPDDNTLHLKTYQRSVDAVVGLPCNWVQMWAFLMWLATNTGRAVGTLTWVGGDVHVYERHADLADRIRHSWFHEWTKRRVKVPVDSPYPFLGLAYEVPDEKNNLGWYDFKADDFYLVGEYKPIIDERAEMVV